MQYELGALVGNIQGGDAPSDLKLMPTMEYEMKRGEIDDVADKLAAMEGTIQRLASDARGKRKEREEYEAIMSHPIALELKTYCGECPWSPDGKILCDDRVRFLRRTYEDTGLLKARMSAMERPSCKKKKD